LLGLLMMVSPPTIYRYGRSGKSHYYRHHHYGYHDEQGHAPHGLRHLLSITPNL